MASEVHEGRYYDGDERPRRRENQRRDQQFQARGPTHPLDRVDEPEHNRAFDGSDDEGRPPKKDSNDRVVRGRGATHFGRMYSDAVDDEEEREEPINVDDESQVIQPRPSRYRNPGEREWDAGKVDLDAFDEGHTFGGGDWGRQRGRRDDRRGYQQDNYDNRRDGQRGGGYRQDRYQQQQQDTWGHGGYEDQHQQYHNQQEGPARRGRGNWDDRQQFRQRDQNNNRGGGRHDMAGFGGGWEQPRQQHQDRHVPRDQHGARFDDDADYDRSQYGGGGGWRGQRGYNNNEDGGRGWQENGPNEHPQQHQHRNQRRSPNNNSEYDQRENFENGSRQQAQQRGGRGRDGRDRAGAQQEASLYDRVTRQQPPQQQQNSRQNRDRRGDEAQDPDYRRDQPLAEGGWYQRENQQQNAPPQRKQPQQQSPAPPPRQAPGRPPSRRNYDSESESDDGLPNRRTAAQRRGGARRGQRGPAGGGDSSSEDDRVATRRRRVGEDLSDGDDDVDEDPYAHAHQDYRSPIENAISERREYSRQTTGSGKLWKEEVPQQEIPEEEAFWRKYHAQKAAMPQDNTPMDPESKQRMKLQQARDSDRVRERNKLRRAQGGEYALQEAEDDVVHPEENPARRHAEGKELFTQEEFPEL
eukprot:TRINITY_DN10545_c0_g1_i1.p1 TRINITY_DN10545_c0_g1~~TRINITY_DN10545_c0_g1_i1.p1  ORF type:complete len:645 (-),score=117.85 TRINITY_DN10545_c0_g1_i1:102-2015(-)